MKKTFSTFHVKFFFIFDVFVLSCRFRSVGIVSVSSPIGAATTQFQKHRNLWLKVTSLSEIKPDHRIQGWFELVDWIQFYLITCCQLRLIFQQIHHVDPYSFNMHVPFLGCLCVRRARHIHVSKHILMPNLIKRFLD